MCVEVRVGVERDRVVTHSPNAPILHLPSLNFSFQVKYGCFDLAADVMAENAHLTLRYLSPDLYEVLDETIMVQVRRSRVWDPLHLASRGTAAT